MKGCVVSGKVHDLVDFFMYSYSLGHGLRGTRFFTLLASRGTIATVEGVGRVILSDK